MTTVKIDDEWGAPPPAFHAGWVVRYRVVSGVHAWLSSADSSETAWEDREVFDSTEEAKTAVRHCLIDWIQETATIIENQFTEPAP